MPGKLHRIVVGYDVTLRRHGDDLVYHLDLPEDLRTCFVDLNLAALPGTVAKVVPQTRPFMASGRAYYRFENPSARSIDVRLEQPGPVVLTGADAQVGEFFAARFRPELPAGEALSAPRNGSALGGPTILAR